MPKSHGPISNPKGYDEKSPTNIRLDPVLKKRMKQEITEAKRKGRDLTLSDIVNEELRKRYGLE